MYLSKIILKNFKSFKEGRIQLAKGMTSIVGANGSGKSNICDAVAFALNATNIRSLRADRLSDLINHQAKDNFAFVELQIEDDSGESFKISREIDSSGVSVYRINGSRTTKFNFEEFLRSKNIPLDGRNIILQGEVTEFIKMSPVERREIIDQLAGISEYEKKKQNAMNELQKVEAKLKEVDFLLGERKRILQNLEKEKVEAEVYLKTKEQLKIAQASLFAKELQSLEKSYSGCLNDLDKLNSQKKDLENKLEKLQEEIRILETEIEELTKKFFERSKLEGIKSSIEDEKADLARVQEKASNISQKISELQRQKQENFSKLKELDEKIREYKQKVESYPLMDSSELISKYAVLNEELKELYRKLSIFEEKKQKYAENVTRKKELIEHKKKVESELNSLQKELELKYDEEKKKNKELREIDSELQKVKRELSTLDSIKVPEDFTWKALQEKNIPGVLGPVYEFYDCDPEFSQAIETAAGNRLFYIITENFEAAKKSIEFLRENKIGRLTFIPLDKIKPNPKKEALDAEVDGVVDFAINLIKYPEKVRKAMEWVFSDTLVVRDLETIKKITSPLRLVTLHGDLSEPCGTLTGGYYKKASLSQIKRYKELSDQNASLEFRKNSLIRELFEIREIFDSLKEKIKQKELELKEIEVGLESLKDYDFDDAQVEKLKESIKVKEEEKNRLEKELSSVLKSATSESLEIHSLKIELEKVLLPEKGKIVELNKMIELKINELSKELQSLEDLKDKILQNLKSKQENAEKELENYSEIYQKKNNLEAKKKNLVEESGKLNVELKEISEKIMNKEIEKAKLEEKLKELKKNFAKYDGVQVINKSMKDLRNEILELEKVLSNIQNVNLKSIEQYDIEKKEIESIENKKNKLNEEYGSIIRMIEEIEQKKVLSFNATFTAINEKFSQYFSEIYSEDGSYATLKLSNPESPLTSGLLLEAKIGTKQMKNIDLLSGGE
ncbi:MAG: AAA family ATPase, partial [archaeon]